MAPYEHCGWRRFELLRWDPYEEQIDYCAQSKSSTQRQSGGLDCCLCQQPSQQRATKTTSSADLPCWRSSFDSTIGCNSRVSGICHSSAKRTEFSMLNTLWLAAIKSPNHWPDSWSHRIFRQAQCWCHGLGSWNLEELCIQQEQINSCGRGFAHEWNAANVSGFIARIAGQLCNSLDIRVSGTWAYGPRDDAGLVAEASFFDRIGSSFS